MKPSYYIICSYTGCRTHTVMPILLPSLSLPTAGGFMRDLIDTFMDFVWMKSICPLKLNTLFWIIQIWSLNLIFTSGSMSKGNAFIPKFL